MPDKKSDNIIQFPRIKQAPTTLSPGAAFLDAIKAIQDAPNTPKRTRKKVLSPTQDIDGDSNTQIAGGKAMRQSIRGNGNIQVAGAVEKLTVRVPKAPKIVLAPPRGSIGANPDLCSRINVLIKQINDYRFQRLGKSFKFGAIYGELAKAFGLKSADWKAIWLWDESRSLEVVAWLEGKRDNTIQGRIKKAAKGEGYQHTRGHLFAQEKDYLTQLGWGDKDALARRQLITGKASRADMDDNEFRNWVGYLRRELERMYEETEN